SSEGRSLERPSFLESLPWANWSDLAGVVPALDRNAVVAGRMAAAVVTREHFAGACGPAPTVPLRSAALPRCIWGCWNWRPRLSLHRAQKRQRFVIDDNRYGS